MNIFFVILIVGILAQLSLVTSMKCGNETCRKEQCCARDEIGRLHCRPLAKQGSICSPRNSKDVVDGCYAGACPCGHHLKCNEQNIRDINKL